MWWNFWWQNFLSIYTGKISLRFVTEASPHSSRRSSQEATKLHLVITLGAVSHKFCVLAGKG